MKIAGFREKPDATAAAEILREHGYETEMIGIEGETSFSRLSDLPEPVLSARWANILLLSNCDGEHFREVVINNHGMVVWQHRPGRFRQLERKNRTSCRRV